MRDTGESSKIKSSLVGYCPKRASKVLYGYFLEYKKEAEMDEVTMDHEKMWKRLRNEMENLQEKGLQVITPAVVLGYMDFIEQIAREGK